MIEVDFEGAKSKLGDGPNETGDDPPLDGRGGVFLIKRSTFDVETTSGTATTLLFCGSCDAGVTAEPSRNRLL